MATKLEDVEISLPTPVIPIPNPIPCEFDLPQISLMGGISLKPFLAPDTPFSDCNAIESLMAQLMAALAGILPIFLISDVIIAILACIQAIPDAITSLSPAPLLECLENLLAAIVALLCATYPPFAIPVMILSWLDFIIRALGCIRDELDALCKGLDRLTNLNELLKLRVQPELDEILEAAETNIKCQQASVYTSFEVILAVLEIINTFIILTNTVAGQELIPEIPIPIIDPEVEIPCAEFVDIVRDLIATLTSIRDLISILDCDDPLGA